MSQHTSSASEAIGNGLIYVDSDMPGLTRVKHGATFKYRDAKGSWLRNVAEIGRIKKLAIPPAYVKVWICPLPNGHLQATGIDARGRKQYRYHADWRVLKDETKFERMEEFGRSLGAIRRQVDKDLRASGPLSPTREQVLASIVRLLDTTYLRVGNEEYATTNGSFGLTTLRNKHAVISGQSIKLRFKGKSGVLHEATIKEKKVASVVKRCQQLPGQQLFHYVDLQGNTHPITSSDVNTYLHTASGGDFTAKDFRTWHGTVQALELVRLVFDKDTRSSGTVNSYNPNAILKVIAAQLGNTPAVCKKAYVHPAVLTLGNSFDGDESKVADGWTKFAKWSVLKFPKLHVAERRLMGFLSEIRRLANSGKLQKKRRVVK